MSSQENPNKSAYDQWAATYDSGLNSTKFVDDLLFPQLWADLRGIRVLEIGCGTGRHTLRLLDQGNSVVGVDLSPRMLAQAKERAQDRDFQWVEGDFLTLPLEQISEGRLFDSAVSALVLEHIRDLSTFFGRVTSLLVRGGKIFISEIHPDRARAGRLAHFKKADGSEVWLDSVAHDPNELESLARKSGLDLLQCTDAVGPESMASLSSEWIRHVGAPMVRFWIFQRRL